MLTSILSKRAVCLDHAYLFQWEGIILVTLALTLIFLKSTHRFKINMMRKSCRKVTLGLVQITRMICLNPLSRKRCWRVSCQTSLFTLKRSFVIIQGNTKVCSKRIKVYYNFKRNNKRKTSTRRRDFRIWAHWETADDHQGFQARESR